jgi:hypothetical protein
MATEHVNITDPQIHEPKGVASAASGQYYAADGAGSGSWTDPSIVTAANQVSVEALEDFPTPSGGVITLADNTNYLIAGVVNIGANRIQTGINNKVVGLNRTTDTLTSTTTNALFTATSQNLVIECLGITVTSGDFINYNGGGTKNLFIEDVLVYDCDTVGTITDANLSVIRFSTVLATQTDGLTYAGTNHGKMVISNATFQDFTGTGIDLGTAVFESVFIGPQVTVITPTSQTGLNVAATSANFSADGRGVISNNIFNGPGTHQVGLTPSDLKWEVFLNFGLKNSEAGAQGSIAGSALNTTFSGTATPKIVNFGTAFVADVQNKFTISTAGRLTYSGLVEELFFCDATIFAIISGGATREYTYFLAKNGAVITSSQSTASYDGSTPDSNSVTSVVELAENDYIELWVQADTATTNLNVKTASLKMFGVI